MNDSRTCIKVKPSKILSMFYIIFSVRPNPVKLCSFKAQFIFCTTHNISRSSSWSYSSYEYDSKRRYPRMSQRGTKVACIEYTSYGVPFWNFALWSDTHVYVYIKIQVNYTYTVQKFPLYKYRNQVLLLSFLDKISIYCIELSFLGKF